MPQAKTYQSLLDGRIYLGGAQDVTTMVEQDGVSVIVDLRAEATGCASSKPGVEWVQIPLGDEAASSQAPLFKAAIAAVVEACRTGKKVGFHCGGGKGRTGTVAVGVLLELGICDTLVQAEAHAKAIRSVISLKPEQRAALRALYPQA